MNKKNIAIVGAGGHTRSLLNLVDKNSYDIIGVYDDSFKRDQTELINGVSLIGRLEDIDETQEIILSYGDNIRRQAAFLKYKSRLIKANLIHYSSIIEPYVLMGSSNQVFSKVLLNSKVSIGDNNIINSSCTIEHETKIGSHNHISVGSIICGRVNIGDLCFIGAGAVIIDKVNICDQVIIGANSVVISDITEAGTYVGNPVRKVK